MSENHLITDVALKALIVHKGKLLLAHDIDDAKWEPPGGRMNEGESVEEGLKREIKEEIGINVTPQQIFDVLPFTSPAGNNHFAVLYVCALKDKEPVFTFNDEVAEVCWVAGPEEIDELPMRDLYRPVLKRFMQNIQEK